ncbi:hypothetical protein CANINC_002724 [Pichia inconspicua]|uniref:Translation initiation factor eIF2 assembly protein n=1 Tax=Pichia inconspicua TaxID=52247 RepID=A0A4T0X0F5_9ASCO|nr:hypothetical protein CANINC_002724 [[Candida] inconspicua]
MQDGQFVEIKPTVDEILACSFSNWYPKFKQYTPFEAEIFKPLPKEFIDYLKSDGIELPRDCKEDSVLFQEVVPNSDNDYSDREDDSNDTRKVKDPTEGFREFHNLLKESLKRMKAVAPKLNWSSPQDATWMMTGRNMRCTSTSDLYLLLKSSDYVNHDMYHAFDESVDYEKENPSKFQLELVLKKWVDINPSMEFRCFVRDRKLIAISQRDLNYYSFLDEIKDELTDKIGMFFDDVLMTKFDLNSFVFDVYIPKPFNRVMLVDINPFQRSTDSLLFSWNEIATMNVDSDDVSFRLVTEHNSGRFATKAHSQNHVPRDFIEASVDTGSMVDFLRKLKEMELNQIDGSDSDLEE